jgi:hypothetical protein
VRPTATATFSIFLTYTSSNNEDIFIQYHWLVSSTKKASPYHERSGENKSRSKTGAALDCKRIEKNYKQQETTTTIKTTHYQDLFLHSLLRGTPSLALPKKRQDESVIRTWNPQLQTPPPSSIWALSLVMDDR